MYKDSDSPAKDFEKKPLPGTTASKPPAPKTPHAKPRGADESDEAYAKRTANWERSQERLKSVGITGGVNKASAEQLKSFSDKYGHGPSGLKEKPEPEKKPPVKPDMSAENPAKKKEPKLPTTFNKNAANQKAPSVKAPEKKVSTAMKAAEKAMSTMPRAARKMRRQKRLMKKASMQGGTY